MKEKAVTVALIISTYNWKDALSLCLKSVLLQKVLPDEIIIADDGSRSDTRDLVELFAANSPVPVIHVWHPDEGFKLAQIRNKAIARATADYVIQIDGDLILDINFIADHLHLAKKGYYISGSRVLLSADTSKLLLEHQSIDIKKFSSGNDRNLFNGMRNPILRLLLADIYKQYGKNKYYVKGCNMSFWREDLLAVNGYNESFIGWGREDSDIAIRLMNYGVRKRFLKMGGVSFHIYHKEASREMEQKNTAMMEAAISNKTVWAEKGLDMYLPVLVK